MFPKKWGQYLHKVKPGGCWRDLPEHLHSVVLGGAYDDGSNAETAGLKGGRTGFLRKLSWDKPSPTLVDRPTNKANCLCHPDDNRPLSIKEYARIQGFEDDWKFFGVFITAVSFDRTGYAHTFVCRNRKGCPAAYGICPQLERTYQDHRLCRDITLQAWSNHGTQYSLIVFLNGPATTFGDYPWRRQRSPYEILVAEVLLKRTTATAAARVYEDFITRFPSVTDIASAEEEQVIEALSTLGLQRQRARAMKRLANWILTNEGGCIPNELERLLAVPGLGSYSASAILSFGHDTPVAILDANVERILARVFRGSLPPRPSWIRLNEVAQRLLPRDKHREYNFGLLDLGRLVCRYVDPKCGECPLNSACDFYSHSSNATIREEPGRYSTEPVNRLRAIRLDKGLSLQQLAESAGVSKLTIIRIEAGRSSPRRETLVKLASALGVNPNQLT